MKFLPLSKARAKLNRILNHVERKDEVVTVTRRGRPVAVIISKNKYDSWQETVEIIKDPELMGEICDGIRGLKRTKKRYTLEKLFGS